MKKTILFAAAAVVALVCASNVEAQTKKQMKDAKKAAKELSKDGWKTDGGHKTIEALLLDYYALETENELVSGRSSGVKKNTKVARSLAKQNAAREYVQMNTAFFEGAGSELEGKLGGETMDDITNAVKTRFAGSVDGKLSVSFVLFKNEADATISCIAYCCINRNVAEQMRQNAMRSALNDADNVKDHQAKIGEIINAAN